MRKPKLPWSIQWRPWVINWKPAPIALFIGAGVPFNAFIAIVLGIIAVQAGNFSWHPAHIYIALGTIVWTAAFRALTDHRYGELERVDKGLKAWARLSPEERDDVEELIYLLCTSYERLGYAFGYRYTVAWSHQPRTTLIESVKDGKEVKELREVTDRETDLLVPAEGRPDTYFLIEDN